MHKRPEDQSCRGLSLIICSLSALRCFLWTSRSYYSLWTLLVKYILCGVSLFHFSTYRMRSHSGKWWRHLICISWPEDGRNAAETCCQEPLICSTYFVSFTIVVYDVYVYIYIVVYDVYIYIVVYDVYIYILLCMTYIYIYILLCMTYIYIYCCVWHIYIYCCVWRIYIYCCVWHIYI